LWIRKTENKEIKRKRKEAQLSPFLYLGPFLHSRQPCDHLHAYDWWTRIVSRNSLSRRPVHPLGWLNWDRIPRRSMRTGRVPMDRDYGAEFPCAHKYKPRRNPGTPLHRSLGRALGVRRTLRACALAGGETVLHRRAVATLPSVELGKVRKVHVRNVFSTLALIWELFWAAVAGVALDNGVKAGLLLGAVKRLAGVAVA
jgi:hypothetical protein